MDVPGRRNDAYGTLGNGGGNIEFLIRCRSSDTEGRPQRLKTLLKRINYGMPEGMP